MRKITDRTIIENLTNDAYFESVYPFLNEEIFDGESKLLYKAISNYAKEYNKFPARQELLGELSLVVKSDKDVETVENYVTDIYTSEKVKDVKWLKKETEVYILNKKVQNSITDGISEFDKVEPNYSKLIDNLKDAVSFSFTSTVGTYYVKDFNKRIDSYSENVYKIPFHLTFLDKHSRSGNTHGYENGTLNMVCAPPNKGKSIFLCDLATKLLIAGKNVLFVSFEMSEYKILERIDANIFSIDINDLSTKTKTLTKRMEKLKESTIGELVVKQYPQRSANVNHINHLIKELEIKNFTPDVVIVDYLGICGCTVNGIMNNTYLYQKYVSEELRGLAVERNIPVWTAGQLNRDGMDSSDVNMSNMSDSIGPAQTADFIMALIRIPELDEVGHVLCKVIKNRYGAADVTGTLALDFSKMRFSNTEIDKSDVNLSQTVTPEINMTAPSGRKAKFKFS